MHVLPQLRELEAKFGDKLIVIGVHSAKYTTEGKDQHLRYAVQRLEIDHPVVNDSQMRVWQEYAVRAWPTMMFVDPTGGIIAKHEGEFELDAMSQIVATMIAEAEEDGMLTREPFPFLNIAPASGAVLAFPSAIQADAGADRLYIADMNHNRIVVATVAGEVVAIFGSGASGFDDGLAASATFHRPHGLALAHGSLFVADTDNHSIRRVDLESGCVTTIAGTGEMAHSYMSGGPALNTDLRSPWDVAVVGDILYISMAGNHQIWAHRLGSDEVRRFAGTGHEGKRDGSIRGSWLAQPSGIEPFGGRIVFADAETSSVRTSDPLGSDGEVRTLVGKDLFDWGDADGPLGQSLLQHTAGVAPVPGSETIYVADTYNNKIKRIDVNAGTITTVAGNVEPGHTDGSGSAARFFEPHGLHVSDEYLYIADTNNHAIRRLRLDSSQVETIELSGA